MSFKARTPGDIIQDMVAAIREGRPLRSPDTDLKWAARANLAKSTTDRIELGPEDYNLKPPDGGRPCFSWWVYQHLDAGWVFRMEEQTQPVEGLGDPYIREFVSVGTRVWLEPPAGWTGWPAGSS